MRAANPQRTLLQLHLLMVKILELLHLLILLNLLPKVLDFPFLLFDIIGQINTAQLLKLIDLLLVLLNLVVCFLYLGVQRFHLLPKQRQTVLVLLLGRWRGRRKFLFFLSYIRQTLSQSFYLSP